MKIYEPKITYNLIKETNEKLSTAEEVAFYVRRKVEESPMQEHFFLISLSMKNHIMNCHLINVGTVNSSLVDFKECFRRLFLDKSSNFIIAHNHPSGECQPSTADDRVTKKFQEMAKMLDFNILDSIIVGDYSYYSYQEAGII